MDRWVLEGDSYSFLRSAPQMFNLQSREGPNRVEIFDITAIPNHRNAISETTCLCDIFGDDGESPSLSSSPASTTFVRREVDQPFPADDANDSSGSYHTANGSDLSDNIEVTYSTPSPKNMPHFSTSETRESESHPLPDESNILSDSKNGLDCTPPATKVNVNDLSHTGNTWEEPQVSVSTSPVNERKITNASEIQDIDSTPAINQMNPENDFSDSTSCPSEEKEPATCEQEEIITAPQHTSTSPFLDKQDCKPVFESTNCESLVESPLEQNNVVSSENKERMNCHSPQEENVLLAQRMINSGSTSELSNASPTDCCPIQEMSTSPTHRDINILPILSVTPELRLTSISPVSREISSTPASTGRSSPELLGLCSNQVGKTSDLPYLEDTYGASTSVSTLPTSDNLEIDSLSVSALSTETRGLVCFSTDGRVSLESPEINETCSSPDHSVPAYSPEPVMIHSPVGYTISPSPKNETIISSTEPEALPSYPVSTRIDYRDICSSPDHSVPAYSPEPVMTHSPVGYTISPSPKNETITTSTEPEALPSCPVSTRIDYRDICSLPDHSEPAVTHSYLGYISPSPTNERGVYSSETEASASSPCCHSDIYPCSDHSVSAHSSEPAIIHSPMSYTIDQSPTNERMVYLTEPDDLPSSPVITGNYYRATPTCSRDSTPALRSITSTPNSRENYLTPEPLSPAPSLELRSVTCSPEIKTISYSILPQNTKSPVISGVRYNVSPNEDLVQSPEVSPTSKNFLSTPENRSRPSSTASDHCKDTALSPDLQTEPSIPLEKAENKPLPIIFEGMNSSSLNPMDGDNFHDLADTETFKSSASVADECTATPQILSKILQDLPSESLDSGLSTVNMEQNQEVVSDNTTDLTVCGTPASPWASSFPISVRSVDKKQCDIEDYDSNKGTEMLEKDCPSNDKIHSLLPVALRESPGVIIRNSGGKFDSQSCREKESGKREGEEEETMRDSSYRGQQVELSFSARNRKGPADHSPALSSRDSKSGIPAGCYFESYPTTLQQQSQLKAQGSQQENKGGARRLQSTAQGKYSSGSFIPPECTGENSYSMGSEFDEADNEVKWFTDLAFRSLSSPQVDYLDVYNSSHRSSTNVSQPSTVDSPGAVAWMTYADLRGSALHENDGSCTLPRDSLDPNKHFEMGSFECVDVALESKEESSRRKRTVPKRQIQLLRRNMDESKNKGNIENVLDLPSTSRHSQVNLVRQHSTPAFVQEEVSKQLPDSQQNDRKRILKKSLSLDDGSPKTQMASCIIKSVLSKKMQDVQKKISKCADPSPSGDENKRPDISPSSFDGVPSNMEGLILNSSQQSECSLLSKDFALGEERISHRPLKKCAPKVPPKPFVRPAFLNTGETQVAGNITKEETKPIVAITSVDDKILVKQNSKSEGKAGGRDSLGGKYNGDSPNACARNTSPVVATPAISMQSKMTSSDTKWQTTPENQEQLAGKSVFMSKTPEITLKPSSIKGKKTSSLKVSLSPDIEHSREISESQLMENAAEDMSTKSSPKETETEEYDDSNKKSVIHKVRDVRKLVKNTYNLSFKASNSTSTEDTVIQEKRDQPPKTPPALHIECKAISWKDKQTSSSKTNHCNFEKQPADTTKISQPLVGAETRDADVTETTSKAYSPKSESLQKVAESNSKNINGLPESDSITKRSYIHCDPSTKMPPRPPSKEREISALVVLPDGTSTSKTFDLAIPDSTQMEATNNSHSVSMLLKEKGMQADIGVCDVLTEGTSATAKHVNRLEVPVQACSSEIFSTEAQVRAENMTCSPTALVDNSSRLSQGSENPKGTLTEESTKEQEKKKMTTTMTQNPTYLATSVKPEVRTFANITKNNTTPVNASKEIELPIQVRSISTDRLKPFVPQKPSYKQSFAEIRSVSSDPPKADAQASSVIKHQTRLSSDSKKNEMPTVMHKDQPNEASSRDTKRLAVSAISSCKPPPIPATTTQSTEQKSTTMTLASLDQHQSSAFFQNTSTCQQQTPSFSQDHSTLDISVVSNSSGAQALGHTQSVTRASVNNRFHTDDFLFYASDDPPSYDERESFSPLRMSDLTPQRSCRYHPTTKQSPCSCTLSSHSHQGHPQHHPHERIPAASRSPGQVLTCPGAPPQAQVRPQQSRADALPVSNATIPHGSALIQPQHNPRTCSVSNSQSYSDDKPTTSGLHSDRRPANRPSPQPAIPAPYHEYSHSANISALDPRPQLFNPQDLPPSFGHDYSNEGPGGAGVLYPENASGLNCGQGPRRVLLDPETGKYFYIEVPMQPLRKMLFDPELGQYVEVLIPQQAMSHSGLYPPAAPPYSSLHSPGLYAPQYLPYAVPSYPAIPGSAQQVRHPEPHPVPTTLQQTSLRYGSPASQMPKNEPKGHSSMDPSYLESMYYIPTGMNASPNSTPSDCYHKAPSSMPPSGGRRA